MGGLVEEDPQVCPSFGSKHDVVADIRRLSLAHEDAGTCRPPPCKGTPAVLLRTHPGLCNGTHRALLQQTNLRQSSPHDGF